MLSAKATRLYSEYLSSLPDVTFAKLATFALPYVATPSVVCLLVVFLIFQNFLKLYYTEYIIRTSVYTNVCEIGIITAACIILTCYYFEISNL